MTERKGPRRLPFNQTESITARLRDLVRNYPKGLGLVKEFLQNADDAGASRLIVIFDRRQHVGTFGDNPAMEVAFGPSILFVNDQVFSERDYIRIQEIGEGGKVHEAARTGRFGQGFNTCYSVSDHPSLMTGEFVAWFDPHHRIFMDGSNATAWPLGDVETFWPDWMKTFEPAGWSNNACSFTGTAFRLPLRSAIDAEKSEILKEPFSNDDFLGILNELHQIGAALLVFLRSVTHLEVREIDCDGKDYLRFSVTTSNCSVVEGQRNVLRSIVEGSPKELLDKWIETKNDLPVALYDHSFSIYDTDGSQRSEIWSVVAGLFRGPDDILLHSALEVWKHNEKAIPWAGAAVCQNTVGTNLKHSGLACFLPLPEQTKWPVWLHGWFDLSSNRRGITRDEGVGETSRSRYKWNKSLMEYAVGKAWALLIHFIQGLPEENVKPYEFWLRPPDKPDDIDSALVSGFYQAIAELPVIRGRDSRYYNWYRLDSNIRDLPKDWSERLSGPLLAEGWVLSHPSLPEFVLHGFRKIRKAQPTISSKTLRYELKIQETEPDIACKLENAPRPMLRKREWIYDLAAFCADEDGDNLQQLPLAILSDGLLHTFTACGRLFLAENDERILLNSFPERFLDTDYQNAMALNSPAEKINLVVFDLSGLLEFVPKLLSQAPPVHSWLISFFDYLTSCDEKTITDHKDILNELSLILDQNDKYCQMGFADTPLTLGSVAKELLDALTALGIPILTVNHDLKAAISRFASKHQGFVWELTPEHFADHLNAHVEEAYLNEAALDNNKILYPLLDFLSSASWSSEVDGQRLSSLRQLRLLPTTCGKRVAAQNDYVYIPGFNPPNGFEGGYLLLDSGQGERWLNLFEKLKIQRLDGVKFIEKVFLPAFKTATQTQCLDYLIWIRDGFRFVERDLTEEDREQLRRKVRQAPILPVEGGGLQSPRSVYRPDAKEPIELLGNFAHVPDKVFFNSNKDLWNKFFNDFDLPRHALARDLYKKIKALSDEAAISGTGNIKAQLRKLIDYIRDRWVFIASKKVDGGLSLADALSKTAWLPASIEENNYAASNKWPDRLWRANELVPPGRLAHLCASKYPILDGSEFHKEMSDALGLVTNLNLNDVLGHFSKVLKLSIHDDKSIEAVHKAAEGFYRYIGQLDAAKVAQSAIVLEDLKKQLCIFIAGKWWHPSLCFFDPLPFPTDWAVSLASTNLSITETPVRKGLSVLGVRQQPDNDDWIQMLTDFADKFQEHPLPQAELNQARHAIHYLRSATEEWLRQQDVFVPLINGCLENARISLYPDDHRLLNNYSGSGSLRIIEKNGDAYEVGKLAGATSLRKALIKRLKYKPLPTQDTLLSALAAKLESNIRSKQFYKCLQRIAYEEATRDRSIDVDAQEASYADQLKLPQKMQVVISPLIRVETIIEIDGEERLFSDAESAFYFENEIPRLWLKEGKSRRIKDEIVRAICELCGLSDQLRLSRVLDTAPELMEIVLDEEEVAPLPEIQTIDLENNAVVAGNCSDSEIVNDYEQEEVSEASLEGADAEEDSLTSSVMMEGTISQGHKTASTSGTEAMSSPSRHTLDDLEQSDSSKSIAPPTKPGHGSSNPWSDKSSSDTSDNEHQADNSEGTSHTPRTHGSPLTPHSRGKTVPHDQVQHPSSTNSTSPPNGPPTIPGHGSSNQWDSTTKGRADTTRQVRMRTYVHEKIHDDYDTGNADSLAKVLGNAGEAIVMEFERKRRRSAKQMPRNHEGYDIESKGRDGTRFIEVKSIDGPWGERGVGVTRAQYEAAMRLGKNWWLYVVEYVTDPVRKKVLPIANPFHLATEFRFDSGWRGVQDDEPGGSPVSSNPKIGASYERESGEIVNIESTTQHGEFWRVSFVGSDGTKQRAIWDASWRKV